jgi:hypothetical protein
MSHVIVESWMLVEQLPAHFFTSHLSPLSGMVNSVIWDSV